MGVANVPSAQGNPGGDYLRYKDESIRTMDKLRSRCVSEGHGIFASVPFVDRRETRRCDWPAHDLTDAAFGQRWAVQRAESFEPRSRGLRVRVLYLLEAKHRKVFFR